MAILMKGHIQYTGLHLFEQLWLSKNKNNFVHSGKIVYFDSLEAIIVQANANQCNMFKL